MTYIIYNNLQGTISGVLKMPDNTWVPASEDNTDYQAYLKWLEEGNEPLPVDEAAE